MRKILLNNKSSKTAVNTTNVLPVNLERDISLFHDEVMSTTIDTMEVYNNEKDESTKYRLIFTMFPVCTNVLHNHLTEVIYQEGHASSCKPLLNTSNNGVNITNKTVSQQSLTRLQAIRNTEYSNDGLGITYHCGSDIFNNHILRSKEDIVVSRRNSRKNYSLFQSRDASSSDYVSYDSFNTIGDYYRDSGGEYIISKFPNASQNYTYINHFSGHTPLYQVDNIFTFDESYANNIKRKDGWIGFNNPSTFHIPVSGTVSNGYYVNKCMNNKEACEFVDLCPERDLFSFTPKKNTHRKRLEYNWKYFITYPFQSIYDDGKVLIGKGCGLPLTTFNMLGSSKSIYYKESNASSGVKTLILCSVIKHNMIPGDKVQIILQNGEKYICEVKETGLIDGTEKDHYFTINKSDIDETIISSNNPPRRFIKIVSGFECEYYFRKFKKLDTEIKSNISRLAFADTVYGDDVSQILFNDDINIDGYVDNLGRPLTEVYLTIIKNNSGYKEWYEKSNPNYNDNSIEFSHVFGKVTSGLDIPHYITGDFPVVRRQHNISKSLSQYGVSIKNKLTPVFIEDDLNSTNNEFYGDLVEFNPITVNETVLEEVKHRFNTAQRESSKSEFDTIYYDEIMGDQYDGGVYGTNSMSGQSRIVQLKLNSGYANLDPEGYVYKPHHKIKLKELSDIVNQLTDTPIAILEGATLNGKSLNFSTEINYGLVHNDVVAILDYNDNTLYRFHVLEYVKNGDKFECSAEGYGNIINYSGNMSQRFQTFKHNLETPEYAYMLPDGTGRHLWREVVKPSELTFVSDLYDTVFTNGAFYHHKNITFPVQRQDPFHLYGMYIVGEDGETQIKNNFAITSTEMDISSDVYIPENDYKTCY